MTTVYALHWGLMDLIISRPLNVIDQVQRHDGSNMASAGLKIYDCHHRAKFSSLQIFWSPLYKHYIIFIGFKICYPKLKLDPNCI